MKLTHLHNYVEPMSNPKAVLDHEPEAVTWARKKAGLSKTALARHLGVSLSLISQIESGNRNATPAMLIRLADTLNCPLVVLERKRHPADPVTGDEYARTRDACANGAAA